MAIQQCTSFFFEDAPRAIDLLTKGAQFKTLFKVDGEAGEIKHCEMSLSNTVVIMLGSVKTGHGGNNVSSLKAGGATGGIYIVMKDKDALIAHFEHAKANAPEIITKEPYTTDYGSWDYSLKIENQSFYFGTYAPQTAP